MSIPALFSLVVAVSAPQFQFPFYLQAQPAAPAAQAAPAVRADILTLTDRQILSRAEASLSGIDRVRGNFVQYGGDGSVEPGRFALSRPGKLRFDYTDAPLVIISDGLQVALQDTDLETTDSVLLAQTPLSLLLRRDLSLARDAHISAVLREPSGASIRMEDLTGQWDGQLTLHFDNDFTFTGWTTLDALGQSTKVVLQDMQLGASLNPRLFIVEDLEQ